MVLAWYRKHQSKFDRLTQLITKGFTMTQASIDADAAAVTALATEIQSIDTEIQALKVDNPTLDTANLDAVIARAKTVADTALADAVPVASAADPLTDGSAHPDQGGTATVVTE